MTRRGEPLLYPKNVKTKQGTSTGAGWRDPNGRRWVHLFDGSDWFSIEEKFVPEVLSQGWADLLEGWDDHLE